MPDRPFTLEFYRSPDGDEPVRRWIRKRLPGHKRQALAAALRFVLSPQGIGVCGTEYGRQLGGGLFEFRLNEDEATLLSKWSTATPGSPFPASSGRILLRVFCHATGDRMIVLLGGYDKGRDSSPRRQEREIARARARLRELRSRRP